jgi:CBS domain-containing protein
MQLDKYIISEHELIEQAIEIIEFNSSRCVIVVNSAKKVLGILSEGDILRAILKGVSIKSPVKNIMNIGFKYLMIKDEEKIKELLNKGITLIPVLNDLNELVDIVTYQEYFKTKW